MDILFPYVTIEQEYGKKDRKSNYEKTTKLCRYHKGSSDPDRCGSDYCGSSLFLSGAEPCIGQQYFRSWNYSYEFYTFTAFSDHDGPECCSFDHRIHNMCGREFGTKTVYTSILLPVFIGIFERIFPNIGSLTKTQELDVLCYVLVVSVGLSILFNMNASSGGLDIVAKIMNKYLHIELGKAMSLAGMCVALSAALVYDKKTVVLSVLGTYFNGMVVDHFIFGQNLKRRVCIITKYEEELRNFILHELHSGATIYDAIGAYNLDKRHEIITIVDKNEYQKLMNYINNLDPKAFITVYTVADMRYQQKVLENEERS